MLDSYRDLIDELLGTPGDLRRAVEATTAVPPAALQLLAELRDRDAAVLRRLQIMTRQDDPYLPAEPDVPVTVPTSTAELLAEFDTARGELVSLLMNLTLKDWERSATHATEGTIVLTDEVERHVEFDEAQVERIRSALARDC